MNSIPAAVPLSIAGPLLQWYDRHRRALPWRALPGETADPYRVWISEIMLQQTVAATVMPYFEKFVARWPSVKALAAARVEDVLAAWAGLGYYARARNLHACAQAVVRDFGGAFPSGVEALLTLPGIGVYTAAAIAAIAFDQPVAAVDGNVERVVARLHEIAIPLAACRPALRQLSQGLVPQIRPGDFAQAMMDLGATICIPASPRCLACPLMDRCAAFASGAPERLPVKPIKPVRPKRYGRVYWITDGEGRVLLQRRPPKGLLGGMLAFPSSDWLEDISNNDMHPPFHAAWQSIPGTVRHVFTHFELELEMLSAWAPQGVELEGQWADIQTLQSVGLPGLMLKVARQCAHIG